MTETTAKTEVNKANGKTQNVIFRNFCCISVLSQSFFYFFFAFLSFGLFVFLILFVCLRKSPARRCTFCSNERLYKPCELRAVSWSRQPALEVIAVAKLSIQLKQMSCCCCCCLVAKWAWLRFWPKNASNSRQLAAKTPKPQVAPVLTQTTWKKKT